MSFSTPKEFEEAYKIDYLTPQESMSLIAKSISRLVDELHMYNSYMNAHNSILENIRDSLHGINCSMKLH